MKHLIEEIWHRAYLHFLFAALIFGMFSLSDGVGNLDWDKEVAYFEYIHQSVNTYGAAPLIWWNSPRELHHYPAISHTSSFVGNPETMLFSPFAPLLLVLSAKNFIKLLVFLHFLIGIAGVKALSSRLKWEPLQVRVFASLVLCSPIVIQHLAIGYTPWINLFLFPWLIFFLEARGWPVCVGGVGAVLSLVLLQGGVHPFMLLSGFFILYSLARSVLGRSWKWLIQIPLVIIVVILLAAARILPTAQAYWNYRQDLGVGYDLSNFLFWAATPPVFTSVWEDYFLGKPWDGVPAWDGGIYWGPPLLLFALVVLKYRTLSRQSSRYPQFTPGFESILVTSLLMLVLSFKSILPWLVEGFRSLFPIPFVEGIERYPYRLAIPAFLGLSVLAAQHAQPTWEWLSRGLTAGVEWLLRPRRPRRRMPGVGTLACSVWLILIVSLIFGGPIRTGLNIIVRDIYQGDSLRWIPWIMESRTFVPLEHYLEVAQVRFQQMQLVLAGCGLAFLSSWWIVQRQLKVRSLSRKYSSLFFELLLLLPLLYASLTWLGKAVEIPYENYDRTVGRFLEVAISGQGSSETGYQVTVTPESLTLHPVFPGSGSSIIVEDIPVDDQMWISVDPDNTVLEMDHRGLRVAGPADVRVVVSVNGWSYPYPLYLSLSAWATLAAFSLGYGLWRLKPGSGSGLG